MLDQVPSPPTDAGRRRLRAPSDRPLRARDRLSQISRRWMTTSRRAPRDDRVARTPLEHVMRSPPRRVQRRAAHGTSLPRRRHRSEVVPDCPGRTDPGPQHPGSPRSRPGRRVIASYRHRRACTQLATIAGSGVDTNTVLVTHALPRWMPGEQRFVPIGLGPPAAALPSADVQRSGSLCAQARCTKQRPPAAAHYG